MHDSHLFHLIKEHNELLRHHGSQKYETQKRSIKGPLSHNSFDVTVVAYKNMQYKNWNTSES